jgi:transcriptional regulator with XRE-family HTH domain
MEHGKTLKKMRKSARFTQQKVNDIMPWWSVSKLSRIENGHQEPSYTEYHELADFYQNTYKVVEFTFIKRDRDKPAILLKRGGL